MKDMWTWIAGGVLGLVILALIVSGGSSRQAYRAAHDALQPRVEERLDRAEKRLESLPPGVWRGR